MTQKFHPAIITNGLMEALGLNTLDGGKNISKLKTLEQGLRGYFITNNRQLLNEIYIEYGLISTVVDLPVQDALRGGIDIKSSQLDEEEIHALQAELEQKEILAGVVGQAHKWNRLFGGAGILMVTDQQPMTPMQPLKKDDEFDLRACDLWEFYNNQMTESSNEVQLKMPVDRLFDYYGHKVHSSRVMIMKGIVAPSLLRPRLRGWGISVVEKVVRAVNQFLKANDLTFEVLDEFKVDVFKIKGLTSSLQNKNGIAAVQNRVNLANAQKNYQNAITMDAEDDYIQKELAFAGIAEVMREVRMQIASELRMPISKIFGVGSAGFSSGEDDIENYNAMIESEIRPKAKFEIIRILKMMCMVMFGSAPDDLTIEFRPLRVLSAEQQENVKDRKFGRLLQARQASLITAKQFIQGCNRDQLLPVQLDETTSAINALEREASAKKEEEAPHVEKAVTE